MNSRLLLAPADSLSCPADHEAFINELSAVGFIGPAYQIDTYCIGPRFSQLLVFMGCAPNILSDPNNSPNHIRIDLPPPTPFAQFHYSKQTKTPLCLNCSNPLKEWRTQLQETQSKHAEASESLACTQCNSRFSLGQLNWRRSACLSRAPLWVSPIFNGEALPSDALLQHLHSAAGGTPYAHYYL